MTFFFSDVNFCEPADNEDSWESNHPHPLNLYKKSPRRTSNNHCESQSDEGESKSKTRQSPLHREKSNTEQSHQSEVEDECNQQTTGDNNNHCGDSYLKSKHGCSLSYMKNDDGHTVIVKQQDISTSKPILKFSVNAILGTDHGKNNLKSGTYMNGFKIYNICS